MFSVCQGFCFNRFCVNKVSLYFQRALEEYPKGKETNCKVVDQQTFSTFQDNLIVQTSEKQNEQKDLAVS